MHGRTRASDGGPTGHVREATENIKVLEHLFQKWFTNIKIHGRERREAEVETGVKEAKMLGTHGVVFPRPPHTELPFPGGQLMI